jgi:hypothetical protein
VLILSHDRPNALWRRGAAQPWRPYAG